MRNWTLGYIAIATIKLSNTIHDFFIRNYVLRNLVLDSPNFKKLLELHVFFIRKTITLPEPQFSSLFPKLRLRFS